jgi:thymidylate kinase
LVVLCTIFFDTQQAYQNKNVSLPENGFDQLACILQKPVVMLELNFMHAFLP